MNKRTREWLFPVTAASMLLAITGVGRVHASQVQQDSQNSNTSVTSKPNQLNQPSNIKASSFKQQGYLNKDNQSNQKSNDSDLINSHSLKNLTSNSPSKGYYMAGFGEPGHTSESNQDKQKVEQYYLQDISNWKLTNWQKVELTRDAQTVLKVGKQDTQKIPDSLWRDWLSDIKNRSDYNADSQDNKDTVNKYLLDQNGLLPQTALKFMEISDTLSSNDINNLTQQMYKLASKAAHMDSGMETQGSMTVAIPGGSTGQWMKDTPDGEVAGALKDPYIPFDLQAKISLLSDVIGANLKSAADNSWAPVYRHPIINPTWHWQGADRDEELDHAQDLADDALEKAYSKAGMYDYTIRPNNDLGPFGMEENIEPYWKYNNKLIQTYDPYAYSPDAVPANDNEVTSEDAIKKCEFVERDPIIPINFRAKFHQVADQALKPFWDSEISAVESSIAGMISQLGYSQYGQNIPGLPLQINLPTTSVFNAGIWNRNAQQTKNLVSGMPGSYQSEDSICQHILADTKIPSDFRQKFADLYHYWTRERVQQTPKMCLDPNIPYNTFAVSVVANNLKEGHTASLQQIIGTKAYDQFKGIKPNSNNSKKQTSGSASSNSAKSSASSSASRPSSSAVLPIINNSAGPSPYDQKSNIPDITPHLHWGPGKSSSNPTSMSFRPRYSSNSTSSASKQPQPYAQNSSVFSSKSSSTSNRSTNAPTEASSSQNRNSMNQSSSMPIYSNANTEVQSSSVSHSDREYNGPAISDNYKSQNEESPSSLKIDSTNTLVNQYLPKIASFGMQSSNSLTNDNQSLQSPIPLSRQELPATGEHAAAYLMLGLILISFGVIIDRRRRTA